MKIQVNTLDKRTTEEPWAFMESGSIGEERLWLRNDATGKYAKAGFSENPLTRRALEWDRNVRPIYSDETITLSADDGD